MWIITWDWPDIREPGLFAEVRWLINQHLEFPRIIDVMRMIVERRITTSYDNPAMLIGAGLEQLGCRVTLKNIP